MDDIKICVIGAGRWGKNHIRTLFELGALGGVVDPDAQQRDKIKELFPQIACFDSLENAFQTNFDGYVVATPPTSHLSLATKILKHGKPVLVEKPLAMSVDEANSIKSVLDETSGQLLVGHILLFHPAIIKMKSMVEDGVIGNLQYIYSNRLNLGVVRKEENVFWSFAPHDISLFQLFSNDFPMDVHSSGGAFIQKNIHDTTITYLKYPNGVQGHIYVSWLHPFKEHRLVIIGSKGSLHFEDSAENKPLLFYEKDSNPDMELLSLKNKPSRKIEYEQSLPLTNELKYFIDVVRGKQIDKATIEEGINVVKILEMATNSLSIPTNSKSPGSKLARRNARRGR